MARRFLVYEYMLRLYPKEYRDAYTEQMVQTLEDMIDDQPNHLSKQVIQMRAIVELPFSITHQQLLFIGGVMQHETPYYLKRDAIIGALLILPFFITIASGILKNPQVMNNHTWAAFFTVLIIVLPAFAFMLNGASFLRWAISESRKSKTLFCKNVIDLRHNWQQFLVGGLGLFIVLLVLGHDSVHCIAGNPYKEFHNWHQTKHCIDTGFLGGK